MRKTSEEFNSEPMAENVRVLCGMNTADNCLPYWETINRYLKNMDPEGLQDILCRLCSRLIRSRAFENARIRGKYWQVIIDGTPLSDWQYEYDLCGNRLEKVDKNENEVYAYNIKNQLASRKSEKAESYYRYDQQGNVLEATGTEGGMYYSYNAFNQQTKAKKSDGSCLESQYDAEYLRAGTVENGEESRFLYYNGELLAELDQNQETAGRYILGYGVAAGWNQSGEI